MPEEIKHRTQVLAIDDEPELLEIIQATLEGEGIKVHTALSGKLGLEIFELNKDAIGLVLLDYMMPEMTGDLVFECLQQIDPDVRVLLLSGSADHVAQKMFAAGLRGYIRKPFYLDDLVQQVREELPS